MNNRLVISRELSESDILRFVNKIDFPSNWTGCWKWNAFRNPAGYGMFKFDNKAYLAHRFMYMAFVGELSGELVLDHVCRNVWCVNPMHMQEITGRENIRKSPDYNLNKTKCWVGHPYTEENTYRYPDGRRECRKCSREYKSAYKRRQRGGL